MRRATSPQTTRPPRDPAAPGRAKLAPHGGMHAAAILLAAGRGRRMRGSVDDKILAPLAGKPVFAWSLAAFIEAGIVARFVVVYRDAAQRARLSRIFEKSPAREWPVRWVRGGAERQHSVGNALESLPAAVTHVFIHDCARPLVHPEALGVLAAALERDGAACLAHRVIDTIKRVPAGAPDPIQRRLRTIDRSRLWAMETPQAFSRSLITKAYAVVRREKRAITDDASALEMATRHGVTLVENPHPNPKITGPADLEWAAFLLARRAAPARPAARA